MTSLKLWGLIASPFQLKMQSLADQAGVRWERWPDQAGLSDAISTAARLKRGRQSQSIDRFPQRIPDLDEYPSVPYYSFNGRNFFYDSTGLALPCIWIN